MAADIRVDVDISSALGMLTAIIGKVQDNVINALDESAAMVQNSARDGHPKVKDSIQGEEAMPYREKTPEGSGEFSGRYRFLTRTGVLRNSVKIEGAKRVDEGYQSSVFSAADYADQMEFGPYPFIRPALELNRRWIQDRLLRAVNAGLG